MIIHNLSFDNNTYTLIGIQSKLLKKTLYYIYKLIL